MRALHARAVALGEAIDKLEGVRMLEYACRALVILACLTWVWVLVVLASMLG